MAPKLLEYFDSLCKKLAVTVKPCFRNGILQILEKDDIAYHSISQALHCLPSHFINLCDFSIEASTAKDGLEEVSFARCIQIRQTKMYRDFINHFISVDELEYVLEKLAIKLLVFRAKRIVSDIRIQEDCNSAVSPTKEESMHQSEGQAYEEKLTEYLQIDKRIASIILLLEGVEVVDYKSIDEKIENIADAIFNGVEKYVERLGK